MLDFMIIGLPRSGTTWAANFFCTDRVLCFHDPLYATHYEDWDRELRAKSPEGAEVGISCTGIWRWADWVNDHPAKKLILHRDLGEIEKSMADIGLPGLESGSEEKLNSITGLHVPWTDLFDEAQMFLIWHHLIGNSHFPSCRHRELINIEMQPKFSGLKVGPDVTRRLVAELISAQQN